MLGNWAEDGGVVYAMSNTQTYDNSLVAIEDESGTTLAPLRFKQSIFKENWSKQNTIHILLSIMEIKESQILDNYAHFVTHGITLISS